MSRLAKWVMAAMMCVGLGTSTWAASDALDSANNYSAGPLLDNDNEGFGFGPWAITLGTGASAELADSTEATADINSANGLSFKFYGGHNGVDPTYADAIRPFSGAMNAGDTLSFVIAYNWNGGIRGFALEHTSGELMYLQYRGGNELAYGFAGGGDTVLDTEYFADATLEVTITQLAGNAIEVDILRVNDGYETNLVSGTLAGPATRIKFYNGGHDGDNVNYALYVNDLELVASTTPTLSITGPSTVWLNSTSTYTVTRSGPVADLIDLDSSNTGVMTVPGSVQFDEEENTVTFQGVAVGVGSTDLTAENLDASSPAFTVTVNEPPTGVYDEASFYDGSWDDNDNEGNGFEAWAFNHTQDPGGEPPSFAGVFIGNPADAGLSGMPSQSFGFYANPNGSGARAEVTRAFSDALSEGDIFQFLLGLNFDSNDPDSNRGFTLYAGMTELINVNMSNNATILVNGTPAFTQYGTAGILLNIQYVEDESIRVWGVGRNGVETFDQTFVVAAGAPDNFMLYFDATDTAFDERQMYINNLQVVDTVDPVLSITGPTAVLVGSTNTYTVTRLGDVADLIDLFSSDTLVMTVPASVEFDEESSTVTFQGVAVGAGSTDLTAENLDATSAPLTVTVSEPPPPVEGIYDEASFYDGTWGDSDNEGAGFLAWSIDFNEGGVFIGSAGEQGPNNDVVDTDGDSFGMWADDFVTASRAFAAALSEGDVFTFQLAYNFDNGNRGFNLYDGEDQVFFFNINDQGYTWEDDGEADPTPWKDVEENPIRENGMVLDVAVTQTASGFDISVTSAQDPVLNATGSFPSGPITGFQFYVAGAGGGTGGNMYFNRLEVVEGDEDGLFISGFGFVGNEPSVMIDVGEDGVTYRLYATDDLTADPIVWTLVDTAVGNGVDPITLTDDDPSDDVRFYAVSVEEVL